jgi:hypothetical protein
LVTEDACGFFRNCAWAQCKIYETGACDRWEFAEIVDVKVPNDFLGDRPRVFAPQLSKHQGRIRLVVAEARIGCLR